MLRAADLFLFDPGDPANPSPEADTGDGCAWWNLVCHGGTQVADSGLSAITSATANGANQLLGEIVKTVDESTQVPLTDPTYQDIYTGFLGLAAPLLGVVLCAATIVAALRRDAGALGRAVVGLVVAGIGGALYVVLAQLLVGLDNWLAHGIVEVTGQDLTSGLTDLAAGFERIGAQNGTLSANMLILVLMLVMLLAGIVLWFVLVLRQIAILVVVAFAPLLIAGYLWAPTRPWVRRATEVLIALVFTKTAIYALFGIGLALLSRGTEQSLSSFVGAVVLLCGACFAPLVMLRLVHFAADTQIAGEMMGTLRGGMAPVFDRLPTPGGGGHPGGGHSGGTSAGSESPGGSLGARGELARQQAQGPAPEPLATTPASATTSTYGAGSTGSTASAGTTAASGAGAAGAAAGPAAAMAAGAVAAGSAVLDEARQSAKGIEAMGSPPGTRRAPETEPPLTGPPPVGPPPLDAPHPPQPDGDQP